MSARFTVFRMSTAVLAALVLSLASLCCTAAAEQHHAGAEEPPAGASASAPPAPALPPGHPPASGLPPGHPPLDPAAAGRGATVPMNAVPPVDDQSGRGAQALVWSAPASWASQTPSSSMRRAQYRVPGSAGDAECVVFYFGPGQGGTPMANAERWAGQFARADGQSARTELKTRELDINGVHVLWAEVAGQYGGGMSPSGQAPQPIADAALLGAIAEGPDANWFFKLTGPAATVEANRQAFEAMIRSLRRGS